MKAVLHTNVCDQVAFTNSAALPELGEQENTVIIKTLLCGLCGSDLHVYSGRERGCATNTINGHELVGEVVQATEDCKHFLQRKVVVPFSTNCGECEMCFASLPSRCKFGHVFGWIDENTGKGLQGCQAEYVRVPLARASVVEIESISRGIRLDEALLCGDILATAYFSIMNGIASFGNDRLAPWQQAFVYKKLLILGCGPVGLLASLCASYLVPEGVEIFVFDLVDSRKQKATAFGATALAEQDITPKGFDIVVECVGAKSALQCAMQACRPGGTISSIGVNTDTFPFPPSALYDSNMCIRSGRCPARAIIPLLGPVIEFANKKLKSSVADWIISHRVSLESASEYYARFAAREEGMFKVVFDPTL